MRLARLIHLTRNVEAHQSGLRHIDIQVGTVVETLILITVVVRTVEFLKDTILGEHTGRDKVLHGLVTTRDVHVVLLLQGNVLHQVIRPLHAREADGVGTILEHVDHALREIRVLAVVGTHGIVESGILIRAGLLYHLRRSQSRERSVEGDVCLSLDTTLGGDEHHTVGTTHTEHGGGRGILQHGDALNLVGVDIPHLTLHTIDLDKRGGVGPCALTTNENLSGIATRLTRVLHGGHTRKLTGQHIVYR